MPLSATSRHERSSFSRALCEYEHTSKKTDHRGARNNTIQQNIAINKEITRARSARDIIEIWREKKEYFDGVNCATALNRLSKFSNSLDSEGKENVKKIAEFSLSKIGDFKAQAF